MGSWNKTCGLTQMPIFSGDEVITFYLIEKPFKTDAMTSYASGYWGYIPLPFYGIYDDYGFLDMAKGEEWKLSLMKDAYGKSVVINEPTDKFVDNWKVDENIFDDYEKFKDAIHRNRLHFRLYHEKNSCISFVMFEKKTFDTLKQIYKPEKLMKILKGFKEYINDINNIKIPDYFQKYIEAANGDAIEIKELISSMLGYDSSIEEFSSKHKINKWNNIEYALLKFWFSKYSSINESGGFGASSMKGCIKEKINSIPENVLIDSFLAEVILSKLRKQWYPAGHEGSQDELNSDHKAFLKAYKARMNVIEHQWDDL